MADEDKHEGDVTEPEADKVVTPEPIDDRYCVKALGGNRLAGYLILFGDEDAPDLQGQWFTPATKGIDQIFRTVGKLPALYHHGANKTLKATPLGVTDIMEKDSVGWWVESQMTLADKYDEAIQNLVKAGKLRMSSGAIPHAAKATKDGEITDWPVYEATYTPAPIEYRMIDRPVTEMQAVYKAVGLELPSGLLVPEGDEESRRKAVEMELERLYLLTL